MIRYLFPVMMLLPATGHAQTFVGVDDEPPLEVVSPELASETGMASINSGAGATEEDPLSTTGTEAPLTGADPSIVVNGETAEELEALLASASGASLGSEESNMLVARVDVMEDGSSVINLANADDYGDEGMSDDTATAVSLELGECNEGTQWVSDDVNCYNAYPTTPGQ